MVVLTVLETVLMSKTVMLAAVLLIANCLNGVLGHKLLVLSVELKNKSETGLSC
jgi:archaellum component FlaG (FlaF/FlaG flagellin family)